MKKNGLIVLITLIISFIGFSFITKSNKTGKIAWVNINKVYGGFEFKKELETKLIKTQEARKAVMDSLEFELKMLSREIKSEEGKDKSKISLFEMKRENYMDKKNQLEEDNSMMQKQYNEQILNQLNQYLKDYGKEQELRYIFGAEGSGSLMYAEGADEITEDVIKYINEKYKGKTK